LPANVAFMPKNDFETIKIKLANLFAEMHVEVPSVETDLFDTGILDSQRLVELLFQIEQRFQTQVDIQDFEIENFRCIEKIAALIADRLNKSNMAQLSKVGEPSA